MTLRIDDQAFRTDTGRQRNANEDSLFTRAPLFVVADGMGGAQAGEVASQGGGRVLRPRAARRRRRSGSCGRRSRRRTGRSTSSPATIPTWPGWGRRSPPRSSTSRPRRWRSATSATAAPTACAAASFERLTRDHSLVEEMRRKGQLTDAQAEDHPQRSIITRALGPEPEVEVDLQTVPAQAGDVFLICSDGLTTMLGDEQIGQLLARRDLDAVGGPRPGRRSQPGRRPRQHHRRRLPPRGRRRSGRAPAAPPRARP